MLVRRTLKVAGAAVLHCTGLRRAITGARRVLAGGPRVLILSYHRVVGDFTGALQRSIPGLLISQETFRRQLMDLRNSGYEFLPLGDALEVLAGRRRARRDVCVVTFDDGYRDVHRYALPVLKELQIPATLYLASGYVGTEKRFTHDRLFQVFRIIRRRRFRPVYEGLPPGAAGMLQMLSTGSLDAAAAVDAFLEHHSGEIVHRTINALCEQLGGGPELTPLEGDVLSWEDVRELIACGVEVGAHTVSHTVLPLEEPERARWEICASKEEIEKRTGRPCLDFAYCNGWYSDELITMLVEAGFRSAVTTEDLPNRIWGDPFALKRKVVSENLSVGLGGTYSSCLTGCQMDGVFKSLGRTVVYGRRAQRGRGTASLVSPDPEPLMRGVR